jgi:hypothetical protein
MNRNWIRSGHPFSLSFSILSGSRSYLLYVWDRERIKLKKKKKKDYRKPVRLYKEAERCISYFTAHEVIATASVA